MNFTTFVPDITTHLPPSSPVPVVWGYVAVIITVVFFGSNFVPVKKFETGDGMLSCCFKITVAVAESQMTFS